MRPPFDFLKSKEVQEFHKDDDAEKFERCSFCNSKLIFTHHHNLGYFQVIESARCTGCGVVPEPKKFTLH
jgi:uncharacterized protein with PIN domain